MPSSAQHQGMPSLRSARASKGVPLASILQHAQRAAWRRGQPLSTAHALLALVQHDEQSAEWLGARGIHETHVIDALKASEPEPSNVMDVVVERAKQLADKETVCGQHFLTALLKDKRANGSQCLSRILGGSLEPLINPPTPPEAVKPQPKLKSSASSSKEIRMRMAPQTSPSPVHPKPLQKELRQSLPAKKQQIDEWSAETYPLLYSIGRNLTLASPSSQTLVGRENELQQIMNALQKSRHPHVAMVGEPGVGKSALAEALAHRLQPIDKVQQPWLIEIATSHLLISTGMRGGLAERMHRLQCEILKGGRPIVMLFDDFSVPARGTEGPEDLLSTLRQTLQQPLCRIILTLTEQDYRRLHDKDPGFCRRFTRIDVEEPKPPIDEVMVRASAQRIESHHGVEIPDTLIRQAIEWSRKFRPERRLPDQALTILDAACASLSRTSADKRSTVLDAETLAQAMGGLTHTDPRRILMSDTDVFVKLRASLSERVMGQEPALERMFKHISRMALPHGVRPLSSLLLVGPTGVGKTQSAKIIAEQLFGSNGLTRVDMNEFSEPHGVARLLGAPAGYVGFEQGSTFLESVRKRPHQLILFDEIEKSHRDVQMALLALLDEGHLADAQGRRVDFKQTIIVMTTNIGTSSVYESYRTGLGFSSGSEPQNIGLLERKVMASVKQHLAPEFFNRLDDVIFFSPLSETAIKKIIETELHALKTRLAQSHHIDFHFDENVVQGLMKHGAFDPAYGARPVRRAIAHHIESLLAHHLLHGSTPSALSVKVQYHPREEQFKVAA